MSRHTVDVEQALGAGHPGDVAVEADLRHAADAARPGRLVAWSCDGCGRPSLNGDSNGSVADQGAQGAVAGGALFGPGDVTVEQGQGAARPATARARVAPVATGRRRLAGTSEAPLSSSTSQETFMMSSRCSG